MPLDTACLLLCRFRKMDLGNAAGFFAQAAISPAINAVEVYSPWRDKSIFKRPFALGRAAHGDSRRSVS